VRFETRIDTFIERAPELRNRSAEVVALVF